MKTMWFAEKPKADRDIAKAIAESRLIAAIALPNGGFYFVQGEAGRIPSVGRPIAQMLADAAPLDPNAAAALAVITGEAAA